MLPEPSRAQEFQVYVISIVLSWILAAFLLTWLGRQRVRRSRERQ